MSYQCLLIVISLWVDAHNHSDFALAIKVILEEVSHFGVSVRHHLSRMKTVRLFEAKEAVGKEQIQYKTLHKYKHTNLICSTHLILPENLNTCPQRHQRLVDVACWVIKSVT